MWFFELLHYITFQNIKLLLGVKIELETSTLKVLSKKIFTIRIKNDKIQNVLSAYSQLERQIMYQYLKSINNKFIIYKLTFAMPKKASLWKKGPKDK